MRPVRVCSPFFFTGWREQREMLSRQQVTRGVIKSLELIMLLIDVDTQHFSGLSMRRAGISAGLSARMQEPVMFLQSGHGKGTISIPLFSPGNV